MLEDILPKSSLVGSRFIVGNRLAKTMLSILYNGINIETGEQVALKVQNPAYMDEAAQKDPILVPMLHIMFYNEEKILRKLSHKGVPKSYGFYTVRQPDNSMIHIRAMEYVPSHLDSFFEGRQFLPTLADFLMQFGEVLSYIHSEGIVHSDIKPQNIMCNEDTIKLIDFNTASPAMENGRKSWLENCLPEGYSTMTKNFAAPEVKCGERPTPSSDIYSFSRVLDRILIAHKENDFSRLKDSSSYSTSPATEYEDPEKSSTLLGPFGSKPKDSEVCTGLENKLKREKTTGHSITDSVTDHNYLERSSTLLGPGFVALAELNKNMGSEKSQASDICTSLDLKESPSQKMDNGSEDRLIALSVMMNLPSCVFELYSGCSQPDAAKRMQAKDIRQYGERLLEESEKPMYKNL